MGPHLLGGVIRLVYSALLRPEGQGGGSRSWTGQTNSLAGGGDRQLGGEGRIGKGRAHENIDRVSEGGELAGEKPQIDPLATATHVASVGEETDAQGAPSLARVHHS